MKNEKLTHQDAVAFSEAVAEYITNRNPSLPGTLQSALRRHTTGEDREARHARIMRIALRTMGLGDLATESVAVSRAEGEAWAAGGGREATEDEMICREVSGLDAVICCGFAAMDEIDHIQALGLLLVAVAKAARE